MFAVPTHDLASMKPFNVTNISNAYNFDWPTMTNQFIQRVWYYFVFWFSSQKALKGNCCVDSIPMTSIILSFLLQINNISGWF